jgi:predicted RNase H-like HicB family nuclease
MWMLGDRSLSRRILDVMSKRLELTAVFESVDQGWIQARIAELPAVITAAPTRDEAREMLIDALGEYLLSLGSAGNRASIAGRETQEPLEITLGT